MISFQLMDINRVPWQELDRYADRTIFQTLPWLNFLAETQKAEPSVIKIRENHNTLGFFTGLILKKYGFKILGSPFKGWTTSYMGFNLLPGVSRHEVLAHFPSFAFRELGCHYLEMMDRRVEPHELSGLAFDKGIWHNLEIDLTKSEQEIYGRMDNKSCRWCIRKAEKSGVVIQEAADPDFAEEYLAQLQEVFGKQSLVPTYGVDRVKSLIKHLLPTGNLLLLRARDEEENCLATGIFPGFNDTAYFWGGASWRQYQKLCPNEPLIWYAVRYWKARGMRIFDLGGFTPYKKKYGGQPFSVPRLMEAKFPVLIPLRNAAHSLWTARQKLLGKLSKTAVLTD